MKNKNIVLFSSGVTERNGILAALAEALNAKGYSCAYWRDLFSGANDLSNIALLPMLIKKIPTFDYAVLICEGHDVTELIRGGVAERVNTMRDNVLFEIGLCTMALGLPRVILVTDDNVRIPDDLVGRGGDVALKRIVYTVGREDTVSAAAHGVAEYIEGIENASAEIDRYISATGGELTPVIIGAASATACGYVNNFIFRTLEHIGDGVETDEGHIPVDPAKVYVHIVIPEDYNDDTASLIKQRQNLLRQGRVVSARGRAAVFGFEIKNGELHIVDYPTTVGTSYDTAKLILGMDADDTDDIEATARFTHKELNLFEATLRGMLNEKFLDQLMRENYSTLSSDATDEMKKTVTDIISRRLEITRFDPRR